MKKWEIINKFKVQSDPSAPLRAGKLKIDDIVKILLENRGLKTKKEIDEFLYPKLESITVTSVGIDKKQLKVALSRIKKAIDKKEQVVVYGDYDVDGICGAAILWETLHGLGTKVMPYIPHRVDEGYGLSVKGIDNILTTKVGPLLRSDLDKTKLIITVDNGIVANEAVDFANKNGIDVIITDHHVPSKKLPKAYAIVHTTRLCGAGVAYLLAQNIKYSSSEAKRSREVSQDSSRQARTIRVNDDNHLELVALATIADLVPLLGANRTLTKFGLEKLRQTKRVGLLALFDEAGINQSAIGTYEVGHLIAPRLNAMGRLEHAMDSLRLLCTRDSNRATTLARLLNETNKERQLVTEETVLHAKQQVTLQQVQGEQVNNLQLTVGKKLIFISHESYQQGVIGLVAGKLVEEFYRPAIVVSRGEKYSKASARSVHGLNIIEFIRSATEFLVDAGGHPMAAGFTVETEKLPLLQQKLEELAEKLVLEEMLTRTLRIDCEIDFLDLTRELYNRLLEFEPFGMTNPQPTFVSRGVTIEDMRLVGAEDRHVKLRLSARHSGLSRIRSASSGQVDSGVPWSSQGPQNDGLRIVFNAIAFGMGQRANEFRIGDVVDIVYTIDENVWNGNRKLQLKIKDIQNPGVSS